MRLGNDPHAPLVEVKWIFTDRPFLPFETAFGSAIYNDEYVPLPDLGEASQPFYPFATNHTIEDWDGAHVCGTRDEFLKGHKWPYEGPDIEYDDQGLPFCCNRVQKPKVGTGARPAALVHGGIPPVVKVATASRPAALVYGLQTKPPYVITMSRPSANFTAGLNTYFGIRTGDRPAALVAGGNPYPRGVRPGARPAAIMFGGLRTYRGPRSGGKPAALVTGGIVAPVVGATCATATVLPYNTPTAYTTAAGVTRWLKISVAPQAQYRFKVTNATGTFTVSVREGDCTTWTEIGAWSGNGCANRFPFSVSTYLFRIIATANATYTVTVEPGTCP